VQRSDSGCGARVKRVGGRWVRSALPFISGSEEVRLRSSSRSALRSPEISRAAVSAGNRAPPAGV